MLSRLLSPLINTIKAEIMNPIEKKFEQLTASIDAEKAEVAERISILEEGVAELKAKIAGGIDTSEVEAKIDAAIAQIKGIVDPAALPTPEAPEASAPDAAEVAPTV
jgi:hypothetical protein